MKLSITDKEIVNCIYDKKQRNSAVSMIRNKEIVLYL